MAKPVKSIKFRTKLKNDPEHDGTWHFLVIEPKFVAKLELEGKSRRVLCSINNGDPFPCAVMPGGDLFYILVNKQRRIELGIKAGDRVDVVLQRDESKYGMPMCEELAEVLRQDPDGDKLFHSLTGGKQRSMIYYIGKVKDIDRRIHTALMFIEHLKKNNGKLIYKDLQQDLKRPVF